MTKDEAQQMKATALEAVRMAVAEMDEQLAAVDPRLLDYVADVARNEPDTHNLMEVLGVCKFLRIMVSYPFDVESVQQRIRHFEGKWNGPKHIEGSGGLKFPGLRGMTYYRLTPIQVFIFAWLYGPHEWVCTQAPEGSRELLPSEEVREGVIWDLRRLVTECILFVTRKFGKTMLAGFFGFEEFFFGDVNSEVYCCANALDQAKLVYKACRQCIEQLDPKGKRVRFTATELNWQTGQPRMSKIQVLSAGGKTKDGLFASLCLADEFGSAEYVKDKSDMASLVEVVRSSMGPRREPLTVITTTAGNISNGPFKDKLWAVEENLKMEVA